MKQQHIVIIILVAVVSGAGGFFAGTNYQLRQRGQQFRMTGFNPSRTGLWPVAGEIIKQDETSITVKLIDGSSKIVLLSADATINKAEQGSQTDLVVGTSVAVFGSENADGSVTAQNIQISPLRR